MFKYAEKDLRNIVNYCWHWQHIFCPINGLHSWGHNPFWFITGYLAVVWIFPYRYGFLSLVRQTGYRFFIFNNQSFLPGNLSHKQSVAFQDYLYLGCRNAYFNQPGKSN